MDHHFYQNKMNQYGFGYQNTPVTNNEFINPSTYRPDTHGYARGENFKLATIYVKPQVYHGISSPADAFKQGTAFKELYRPFVGKGGQRL